MAEAAAPAAGRDAGPGPALGVACARVGRSGREAPVESSDEQLCRAVAERQPGAFDLLVERYQERAYRIAWSVLRDREEARD